MLLFMTTSFDERWIWGWRATAAPPGENDQDRQPGQKPHECERAVGDVRISRIIRRRNWRRGRHAGEAVQQRQNLARTGGAADVGAGAVAVFDLAIGVVAGGRREIPSFRAEANGNVRHHPFELCQHVSLQVHVTGIFGRETDGDGERLGQRCELALIGEGKRIALILAHVARRLDLRRQGERDRGNRDAQRRAHQLLANRDTRRQPDARERGETAGRDGDSRRRCSVTGAPARSCERSA